MKRLIVILGIATIILSSLLLKQKGVDTMLIGNMSHVSVNKVNQGGIRLVREFILI